jgi:hypothetical protein
MPPAARGPSARGAYMLRKSFGLVFIRCRVRARHHDQGFITVIANHRTEFSSGQAVQGENIVLDILGDPPDFSIDFIPYTGVGN